MSGSSSYTGDTWAHSGTLPVNGTSAASSVQSATWNYYLATPIGSTAHDGVAYATYSGPLTYPP